MTDNVIRFPGFLVLETAETALRHTGADIPRLLMQRGVGLMSVMPNKLEELKPA
jgi:hypothetical protein